MDSGTLSWLDQLVRKNIKLVAFDMDQTAVCMHSRGRLRRGEPLREYVDKVSPSFLKIVPRLQEAGIHLAIATHSDEAEFNDTITPDQYILGHELASVVIRHHFGQTVLDEFKIIAYNPRVHPDDGPTCVFKRFHMQKLCTHFSIVPQEIMFFDDVKEIVDDCKSLGVHAIKVNPALGFQLEDLVSYFDE